ncbi:MAG: AraC family ligand binding domain-containing protein [Polyangiaceae bacterium]
MQLIEEPSGGERLDARETMYPATLEVCTRSARFGQPTSTCYVVVIDGVVHAKVSGFELSMSAGAYFSSPGEIELGVEGRAAVIERYGFRGLVTAGRWEPTGRLTYIDGCSDTLLVPPPREGDSCLNHLHFPPGITQSIHSHPSIRLGAVSAGRGTAYGPGGWEQPLRRGSVFLLDPHEAHAFKTASESLDVIAFHPDSDWGPTDSVHPMLNRTYLRR